MKHIITTSLGDFVVYLTYSPAQGDLTLNRFTSVINRFATHALVFVTTQHPELDPIRDSEKIIKLALELFNSDDEAKIEKALFDSNRAANGAGPRVRFSLAKKVIDVTTL